MKTQMTGRNVNSRLCAITSVKFMFIWNKTEYYVKQRCKHSSKLSGTKYLKCSITIFLNLFRATKTKLSLKPSFTYKTQKSWTAPYCLLPWFQGKLYKLYFFFVFPGVFFPSFFIISCKMNLENIFSYKKLLDLILLFHFKKLFIVSSSM